MRQARSLAGEEETEGFYHCVSRVVDKRFAFKVREKDKLVALMRAYEEFSGVQVLTFCMMSNHWHMEVRVPKRPTTLPSDEELVRLARRADIYYGADRLEGDLRDFRASGQKAKAEALRERFFVRMWDISKFMKSFKQRFTQWFNKTHERTGTLWEGRFKSVLADGSGQTLATMAAYIDLNPVRAGLVSDPKDYRWCGYAQAVVGVELAVNGLKRVVEDLREEAHSARETLASYRSYLFENGGEREAAPDGTVARPGFSAEKVEAVLAAGGKLPFFESLRCRVRYFTDGYVIGGRAFVEAFFKKHRREFGAHRKDGARELRQLEIPKLFSVRDLRRRVVSRSVSG